MTTGDEQPDLPNILTSHSANSAVLRALHGYALALTAAPAAVEEADVRSLLEAGPSARDVIDADQVVAYFDYVNRPARRACST